MQMAQAKSRINPLASQVQIGQKALIKEGSLKGNIVEICSLPSKKRVTVFFHFLGSMRRVTVLEKDLAF